jgi:hypothetical protein
MPRWAVRSSTVATSRPIESTIAER